MYDWEFIQTTIDSGYGFAACHRRFGIAHATWVKAIERGDLRVCSDGKPYADARKRYDWTAIQLFYDAGHSIRECRLRFGFTLASWSKAQRAGKVRSRPLRRYEINELARNRSNRGVIKRRLLEQGKLLAVCALCGISDWQGKPLTLQIDHINGKRLDYRLENLRILCPNCHSQTETFAGRNLVASRRNPG